MPKIAVIIGSTREGRVTEKLAKWVAEAASKKADVEKLDLRDYPMPLFDEPMPPRYNPSRPDKPEVKKWTDKVAQFDGYFIVTPEYNRSMTGVLKNAIDSTANEMADKPAAIVGHGSSGGAQAIASLRITLPGIGVVTHPDALFFTDGVANAIDDAGMLKEELKEATSGHQANLDGLVDSLIAYADSLKSVRN